MYHFQNTIGRGNFSVVKLAVHVPSQTKVAVKVTDKLRLTEDTSTLIAREIEILKSLKHPNIIGLFQVVSANSAYYIVNEYMDGGDLFELISKNGRLAELRSKCIFFQLANAVDYLHENHICHRDIKAENVLLTHSSRSQYDVSMMMNYLATNKRMDNNEFISLNKTPMLDIVKICDFGFSCRMTGKENAENGESKQNYELLKTWCGSPPYAAPELFEGQPYIGSRIDIWSLGVLLYAMLCGILPFSSQSYQSLKLQVLRGDFNMPFFVSPDAVNLINRMLVVRSDRRYTAKQVLETPWIRNLTRDLQTQQLKLHGTKDFIDPKDFYKQFTNASKQFNKTNSSNLQDSSVIDYLETELSLDRDELTCSISEEKFDIPHAMYLFKLRKNFIERQVLHPTLPQIIEPPSQSSPNLSSPNSTSDSILPSHLPSFHKNIKDSEHRRNSENITTIAESYEPSNFDQSPEHRSTSPIFSNKNTRRASIAVHSIREKKKLNDYLGSNKSRKRASLTTPTDNDISALTKRLSGNVSEMSSSGGDSTVNLTVGGGPNKTVYIGRLERRRASDITSLTTFQQRISTPQLTNFPQQPLMQGTEMNFGNVLQIQSNVIQANNLVQFGNLGMISGINQGLNPGLNPGLIPVMNSGIIPGVQSNNLISTNLIQTNLGQTHLGLEGEPAAEPIPTGMMLNFNQFTVDTVGVTRQLQNISVDEIPSARRCSLSIHEQPKEESDEFE